LRHFSVLIHSFQWHVQNVTIPCFSREPIHSSLLYTFFCHPCLPTVLPSFLMSSCHRFLGLPLNLVSKFSLFCDINNKFLNSQTVNMVYCCSHVLTNMLKVCLLDDWCRQIKSSTGFHEKQKMLMWLMVYGHNIVRSRGLWPQYSIFQRSVATI
jgi:hypothetical protein